MRCGLLRSMIRWRLCQSVSLLHRCAKTTKRIEILLRAGGLLLDVVYIPTAKRGGFDAAFAKLL